MDNFNHGAQPHRAFFIVRKELGRKQQQYRTYTLAAARAQVLANIGNGADTGNRIAPELALNRGKVFTQQLKHFFGGDGGR